MKWVIDIVRRGNQVSRFAMKIRRSSVKKYERATESLEPWANFIPDSNMESFDVISARLH